jgi:hypothetical protein
MAVKYPAVLNLPEKSIEKTINTLRGLGYKEEHRTKLLRKYPKVFDLNKTEMASRIGFLNTYFESSSESLKVILNSVEALVDNEDILRRKLRYLIIGMAHSTAAIKNCSVLSESLQFIKIRHEFLICAGLFKPVPYRKLIKVREKEKSVKTARPKYFKPDLNVCTSDDEFLKRCTKRIFTPNDLAAFEENYLNNYEEDDEDDLVETVGGTSLEEEEEEEDEEIEGPANSTGFSNKAEEGHFYF